MLSADRILSDMTRASGTLCDKTVYLGDVRCQKLNGVPISVLKSEGNDELAPSSFSEVYRAAQDARAVDIDENKKEHDYDYGVHAMITEGDGLPGVSKSVFLKNSAIGSKRGGVFGNKVSVLSSRTSEESEINPFAVTTNSVVTDAIKMRHIKIMNN